MTIEKKLYIIINFETDTQKIRYNRFFFRIFFLYVILKWVIIAHLIKDPNRFVKEMNIFIFFVDYLLILYFRTEIQTIQHHCLVGTVISKIFTMLIRKLKYDYNE